MKRIFCIMCVLMPSILLADIAFVEASASDVSAVNESEVVRDMWLEKKIKNINNNYENALKKIKESTFSESNKKILSEQAEENRNLAIECAKKRNILRDRHRKERENLILQMKQKQENRKAVQEVINIH